MVSSSFCPIRVSFQFILEEKYLSSALSACMAPSLTNAGVDGADLKRIGHAPDPAMHCARRYGILKAITAFSISIQTEESI